MNKEDKKLFNSLVQTIQNLEYDEDIKTFHYTFFEKTKILPKDTKVNVGLINVPCGGFGDIVCCKIFSNYLKEWYPKMKVTICTAAIDKFKSLKIPTKDLVKLKARVDYGEGGECEPFDNLKFTGKIPKYDIIIVVPLIDQHFSIHKLQKLIPYANIYNSFSVSEYNGDYGPYAFPIGVGKDQLGLLLTDMKIKKHNFIDPPYTLAYTSGHDRGLGGVTHANTCLLSFIEMISKKYKKHKKLQLIIPTWFCSDSENEISILNSPQIKTRYNNIVKKNFNKSYLVLKNNTTINLFDDGKGNNTFILRGDILPKPREDFISLIKYSLPDVLLTGDQSVTDGLAYSNMNKRIWYQISPWKLDLAHNLSKSIPNKYLDNFRTSCGTLRGIHLNLNNQNIIKKNDFRIKGKKRMDSILKFYSLLDHPMIQILTECIIHSRYKDTTLNKFNKKIKIKYNL